MRKFLRLLMLVLMVAYGRVDAYSAYAQFKCGHNRNNGKTLTSPTADDQSNYTKGDITLSTSDDWKRGNKTSLVTDYWAFGSGNTVTITSTYGALAHVYISFNWGDIGGGSGDVTVTSGGGTYGQVGSGDRNGHWIAGNGSTYSVTFKFTENVWILWFQIDYVGKSDLASYSFSGSEDIYVDNTTANFGTECFYTVSGTDGVSAMQSGNYGSSVPIDHSCYVSTLQRVNLTISGCGTTHCSHDGNSFGAGAKTTYTKHFIQKWKVTTSSALHTDGYSYATFCHQNIMLVPNGFTAFTYTKSGNKMKPGTSIGGGSYIPANVPVIIRYNKQNTASQTATFTNPDGNTATTATVPDNAYNGKSEFLGNASSSPNSKLDTKNYKYYFLMKDSRGGLNFLRYSSNTCPGHACYVCLSASAAAKGFVFEFPDVDGGTTGIGGVTAARPAFDPSAPMYNAAGQRVGASYKGIVIQNGRKFVKR